MRSGRTDDLIIASAVVREDRLHELLGVVEAPLQLVVDRRHADGKSLRPRHRHRTCAACERAWKQRTEMKRGGDSKEGVGIARTARTSGRGDHRDLL